MIYRFGSLFLVLGWCLLLGWSTPPAAAGPEDAPQALMTKAVGAMQRAEQLVAEDPEAALAAAKEARLSFSELQKLLAAKLPEKALSEEQLEQEKLHLRLAEELFKKGELFQKAAQEKLARSQELRSQGEEAAAQNLEGVAQIEGRLSLQNYVRSMLFGLKNQQLILEAVLKSGK